MGSPPPAGTKKEVLKFRSVNSIVIAPANTGIANRRRIVVNRIDQTNKGIIFIFIAGIRIFIIVEIKFTAPKIEDTPAKCKEKINKSIDFPGWNIFLARGG
jgi:hypothetical protein